jgi:hypothetical protein
VHNFSNRKLSISAGSKDNLEIVHGNSDFTLEKDAVVEPTTEEAEDRKLDANDKKKKKEEELKKQKEMANSDSTVTTKYCRKDFLLTYG